MPTAKLSRDDVVDAALELADAGGLESLTIRRLATHLGVTPMALYWHVKDKDELLTALGDRLFQSVRLPEPQENWFADLCAVAQATVVALREHPAVAPLALPTVMATPAGVVVAERVLSLLGMGGFSDRDAANIGAYLLASMVTLVTTLSNFEAPKDVQDKMALMASLPADEFPSVLRVASHLVDCDDPERYLSTGIDMVLLGVGALAERV